MPYMDLLTQDGIMLNNQVRIMHQFYLRSFFITIFFVPCPFHPVIVFTKCALVSRIRTETRHWELTVPCDVQGSCKPTPGHHI